MKGILLISHGKMAEGLYDSLKMLLSEDMLQIDFLSFALSDGPDFFKEKLLAKLDALDTGEGIVVFADVHGGTPANIATALLLGGKEFALFAGMNLPMVQETMFARMGGEPEKDVILSAGRDGVISINQLIEDRKKV